MLYFFGGFSVIFHIWAFFLESIFFMNPKVYKLFGIRSTEDARIVKLIAFNQGFYNLFLAFVLLVGLFLTTHPDQNMLGTGLVIGATSCMIGAGIILIISKPDAWYAGLTQSIPPMITMISLFL